MSTIYLVLLVAILAVLGYMVATGAISLNASSPSAPNVNGGCQSCPQQR